jgi:cation diffusion facilitator family transporter
MEHTVPEHHHPHSADPHGSHPHGHGHAHGSIDPSITASARGMWAVKWSLAIMGATAVLQFVVVLMSHSVALLADTIHNFGDAATAIPLGIAFLFSRRKPSKKFTYGFGRVEDLAGMIVVLLILISAAVAAYEAINRLLHPQPVTHLWAVVAASVIGFLGNEGVAIFRIRVGKEIGSAALVADGYHARVDGWTSLAVVFGALGVWFGYPLADPVIGLVITIAILWIVWQSGKEVFTRVLDGIEPERLDEIRAIAEQTEGVIEVTDVRARWIGHRIHAEINVAVAPGLTVEEGHEIARRVQQELVHTIDFLSSLVVHVDPEHQSGERHHHPARETGDQSGAHKYERTEQ